MDPRAFILYFYCVVVAFFLFLELIDRYWPDD